MTKNHFIMKRETPSDSSVGETPHGSPQQGGFYAFPDFSDLETSIVVESPDSKRQKKESNEQHVTILAIDQKLPSPTITNTEDSVLPLIPLPEIPRPNLRRRTEAAPQIKPPGAPKKPLPGPVLRGRTGLQPRRLFDDD